MYGVIVALVPAILASFYFFGLGSAVVLLASVAACVFFEWAITKYILKTETSLLDGSAIITGLLLGMNLPSNLPLWIIIIGALFAIGVGKMSFGGLQQSFQPRFGRSLLPARQLPCTDDLMACGWTAAQLYRCHNSCHSSGYHEDSHQDRRQLCASAVARLSEPSLWCYRRGLRCRYNG